jgi:hypothetical protein
VFWACCAHGSANRAARGPCIGVDACCPSRRARIRVWLDDERRAQGLGRGRACRDMTQRRVGDTWSCWLRGRKGLVDGISPCNDGRRRGMPGVQKTRHAGRADDEPVCGCWTRARRGICAGKPRCCARTQPRASHAGGPQAVARRLSTGRHAGWPSQAAARRLAAMLRNVVRAAAAASWQAATPRDGARAVAAASWLAATAASCTRRAAGGAPPRLRAPGCAAGRAHRPLCRQADAQGRKRVGEETTTRGGIGRERGGEGSPAGTVVKGYPPEELEPPLTWAGKGDRSADRGRSGGDDAWGPPVRMRGRGDESTGSGEWA